MKLITIDGKPILWNHDFEIGTVERSWLGDDGWLHVTGSIYTDTPEGRVVAHEIETGTRNGLSLTHVYDVYDRMTDEPGYFERKKFTELSVCRSSETRRPGCKILKGGYGEIEADSSITESGAATSRLQETPTTSTMEAQAKAAYELKLQQGQKEIESLSAKVKEAEGFETKYAAQQQRQERLETQMKEKDLREKALESQLEEYTERARSQLETRQTAIQQLLGDSPDVKSTLDGARSLVTDQKGVEKMDALFSLVEANMRGPNNDDARAAVDGYKAQALSGRKSDDFFERNRKRFRAAAPGSGPSGGAGGGGGGGAGGGGGGVSVSLRDLAILQSVEEDRRRLGLDLDQ